jgi:hypothetical protein
MPNRFYSSTAGLMQLVSPLTSVATTLSVDTVGGLPTVPFTLVLDPSTTSEEILTVTEVSGTTLTVVRAQDGTSAVSHSAGAGVRHMLTARDATEFAAHADQTVDVHGLTGGAVLVGTTTAQTLSGKTISGTDNTLTDIPGAEIVDGSIPDSALGSNINADTWGGIKPFIGSATPSYSGAANTAIWFVTT